jgi:hypothetical protein
VRTSIAENALQIDTYSRYALFLLVWLCCFIYDSMVWFGQYVFAGMVWFYSRRLALSYSHSRSSNHPIFALFPLFMRFLEWLVTSFSFSFIYILILSSLLVVYDDCF